MYLWYQARNSASPVPSQYKFLVGSLSSGDAIYSDEEMVPASQVKAPASDANAFLAREELVSLSMEICSAKYVGAAVCEALENATPAEKQLLAQAAIRRVIHLIDHISDKEIGLLAKEIFEKGKTAVGEGAPSLPALVNAKIRSELAKLMAEHQAKMDKELQDTVAKIFRETAELRIIKIVQEQMCSQMERLTRDLTVSLNGTGQESPVRRIVANGQASQPPF